MSSVQQVTVFVVNLQGPPFMTGLSQNSPLLYSLTATFILTFMFASETVPGLNRYFQLVPFPSDEFRDFVLLILAMDLVATFLLDRLMQFLFCRDILMASFQHTTSKDVMSLLKTLGVMGMLLFTIMGNSDTWDELLAMEEEMTNGGSLNSTIAKAAASASASTADGLAKSIQENITSSMLHDGGEL